MDKDICFKKRLSFNKKHLYYITVLFKVYTVIVQSLPFTATVPRKMGFSIQVFFAGSKYLRSILASEPPKKIDSKIDDVRLWREPKNNSTRLSWSESIANLQGFLIHYKENW